MKLTYMTILQNYFHRFQADVSMAGCSRIEPGWRREEFPDYCRFLYVRQGRGWIEIDGQSCTVGPGDIVMLPDGKPQSFGTFDQPAELAWCHFRPANGSPKLYNQFELPISVASENPEETDLMFLQMVQAFHSSAITKDLRVKSAFLSIVATYLELCDFSSASVEAGEMVEKMGPVIQYINDHLSENILVDELARLVFLHPNYFISFFKNMTGCSPIQYVNIRRLERARRLMEETEDNIAAIAKQVGMQNHYLSRLFRQHYGVTPTRYRQIYRASNNSENIEAAKKKEV